jgi:hypothetical protein
LNVEVGLIVLGIVILAGGIAIGVGACFAWAYHAIGVGACFAWAYHAMGGGE